MRFKEASSAAPYTRSKFLVLALKSKNGPKEIKEEPRRSVNGNILTVFSPMIYGNPVVDQGMSAERPSMRVALATDLREPQWLDALRFTLSPRYKRPVGDGAL